MARTTKTPKQRAEETLRVANRRVVRADAKVDALEVALIAAKKERTEAMERRDYARKDPALNPGDTATTGATATPRTSTTGGTS